MMGIMSGANPDYLFVERLEEEEMTKKYKLLKDLPDLEAGATFIYDGVNSHCKVISERGSEYIILQRVIRTNPDWFQEIEEKSDVEEVAEWLKGRNFNTTTWVEFYNIMAKKLLEAGLDPKRLK